MLALIEKTTAIINIEEKALYILEVYAGMHDVDIFESTFEYDNCREIEALVKAGWLEKSYSEDGEDTVISEKGMEYLARE